MKTNLIVKVQSLVELGAQKGQGSGYPGVLSIHLVGYYC